MNARFSIIPATFIMTACQLGSDFQLPKLTDNLQWKKPSQINPSQLPDTWWMLFNDSMLTSLVNRALAANNDLAAAKARVDTSYALIGNDRAKLFPQLDLTLSANTNRSSSDSLRANLPPSVNVPLQQERLRSSLNLAYDPDLWGKNKRATEATSAQAAAAAALLDSQRLGIATEVARQYFLLRGLDAQIVILKKTIRSRQDALDIQNERNNAGLEDGTVSSFARAELELTLHDLSLIERQRGRAENALAVLCATTPSQFSVEPHAATHSFPKIRPDLPASVLGRRPDVRAAEQELRAAHAKISVAEAAFYPNLNLSTSTGFEALDLARLVDWENRILSIGAGLTSPIFNAGSNKASYKAALSRYDEALATYQQTLLIALREVEDSLIDLDTLTKSQNALENALKNSQETLNFSRERYQKGIINYLEVNNAERSVLQIQLSFAQTEADLSISMAILAKSLGGGWARK